MINLNQQNIDMVSLGGQPYGGEYASLKLILS